MQDIQEQPRLTKQNTNHTWNKNMQKTETAALVMNKKQTFPKELLLWWTDKPALSWTAQTKPALSWTAQTKPALCKEKSWKTANWSCFNAEVLTSKSVTLRCELS